MPNKKYKILVTGSAGFIGSHIFDRLLEAGYDVQGVDDLSGGFMRNVSEPKRFTKLDLRDRQKTEEYVNRFKPDMVYHLAADATEGRSQFTPFSAVDRNTVAYMNLIVPAIKNGMKKMVLTSSMSVYGKQQTPFKESMEPRPEDIYGIAKASMEEMTKVFAGVYGFKYVILRPHNVYGPRQNLSDPYRNVAGIFINRLLHDKNFYIYGNGKQKRAFSCIDDVAPAMVQAALSKSCEGKAINIGSDQSVTLNELARTILSEFFGANIPKKYLPFYLPDRPREVKYAFCDHAVARKLLDFKHRTELKDGIKSMITWARGTGAQKFVYLTNLDLTHSSTPSSWKSKLI